MTHLKLKLSILLSIISILAFPQKWQVGSVDAFNGEFIYATIEGTYTSGDNSKNMISSYDRKPEFGLRTDKTKENDIELLIILYGLGTDHMKDMSIQFRFPSDSFILTFDLIYNKAAKVPMFVIMPTYGDILSQGTLIQRLKRFEKAFVRIYNSSENTENYITFSLEGSSSAIDQVLEYY
jgi:hypothetical protein